MKFTFKCENISGRYSSFYVNNHLIKYNKKEVGYIIDEAPYIPRFMVKKDGVIYDDYNDNCSWMWIELPKKSETLQDAKDFVQKNIDKIRSMELHSFED